MYIRIDFTLYVLRSYCLLSGSGPAFKYLHSQNRGSDIVNTSVVSFISALWSTLVR